MPSQKSPPDLVSLKGIPLKLIIGTLPWERQHPQALRLDCEIPVDAKSAAQEDCLTKTIDYSAFTEKIIAFAEKTEYQLIETLIEKLAEFALREFSLPFITLSLHKSHALGSLATDVMITITRHHAR